jgi:hypothetical protein
MGAHAAHNRWIEVALLLMGTALWLFITNFMLAKTGSALPHVVRKRLKLA